MGSINGNGLKVLRRELVESYEGGRLDIMGVQETHIKGCRAIDCMIMTGSQSDLWKGE